MTSNLILFDMHKCDFYSPCNIINIDSFIKSHQNR